MMGKWEKVFLRKKSMVFVCSECHEPCICIKYDFKKHSYCNYRYCPYCGSEMEVNTCDNLPSLEKTAART